MINLARQWPGLLSAGLVLLSFALAACHTSKSIAEREIEARQLFTKTAVSFHLPSADASGPAKAELLNKAASGYNKVLSNYGDIPRWSAQAMRSLGNVRVAQGRLDDAINLYEKVPRKYPAEEWEILQSLKSAADLLWDAGKRDRARVFYRQIIATFDRPAIPPVARIIVNQAKKRCAEPLSLRSQPVRSVLVVLNS